MKTLGILTALLLLIGWADAGPTTTTAPAAKVYTLGDDKNESISQSPSADQIKAAIASLDGEKNSCVYLKTDETHCIQANWEKDNQLSFVYVDGGDQHMFETHAKNYPPEMAMKLLQSYMSGKDDWLKMVDWEPMK